MCSTITIKNENGTKVLIGENLCSPDSQQFNDLLIDPSGNREGITEVAVFVTCEVSANDFTEVSSAGMLSIWVSDSDDGHFGVQLTILDPDCDFTGFYFGSRWTAQNLSDLVSSSDLPIPLVW